MIQYRGIPCCGECMYYNLKKHKCTRGCTDEGDATDHFYRDCPLPVVAARNNGEWTRVEKTSPTSPEAVCPFCRREVVYQVINGRHEFENFCPHCGAKLREVISV